MTGAMNPGPWGTRSVDVAVPPDGVTVVAPDGTAPNQVVATRSTATDVAPVEFDPGIQGLMGMREGQAAPWDVVSDAVRRGTPSGLEFGSYGALADGTPVFAFMGENGQRQIIRLTPQQWMAGLENRSQARRETQYRIDKKKKQETLRPQFQSLVRGGSFDEFDRSHLEMLWQLSPETAIAAVADVRNFNLKRDAERRMYGGGEVLGSGGYADFVRMATELQIPIPSAARQGDWHDLLSAIRDRYADETTVVRGRRVPVTAGAATLLADMARESSAARLAGSMSELAGSQSHMDSRTVALMRQHAAQYEELSRRKEEISSPDLTIMDAVTSGRVGWDQLLNTLATVTALEGSAPIQDLPIKPDGTINWQDPSIENAVSRARRILTSHITRMGWIPTDVDQIIPDYLEYIASRNKAYSKLRFRSANERAARAADIERADWMAKEAFRTNERIRRDQAEDEAMAPAPGVRLQGSGPRQSGGSLPPEEQQIAESLGLPGWEHMTPGELRDELARILKDQADPMHNALKDLFQRSN